MTRRREKKKSIKRDKKGNEERPKTGVKGGRTVITYTIFRKTNVKGKI